MTTQTAAIRRWIFKLLLVAVMGATWSLLWLATRHAKGLGSSQSAMALLVLIGVTAVLHHLLRTQSDSWLKSAALAGVITLAVMAGFAFVGPVLDYLEFG